MKWIASKGGPLVLLPRSLLAAWRGRDGSDYERACAVGEIGTLDVGRGRALVLGDDPNQTTVLWPAPDVLWLVRWICADSEDAAERALIGAGELRFEAPTLTFEPASASCVLFDSALRGDEIAPGHSRVLELTTPVAAYEVATATLSPDDDTSFVIHRLKAVCS